MADMGTKEAAALWGVSQRKVQQYCRTTNDKRITQEKREVRIIYQKTSPTHLESKGENE